MIGPLPERIASGRIYVLDGAMGTMLYAKGVFVNVCYDELNLTSPDLVREIHGEYLRAGAQLLETNTFGANPVKLSAHGLDHETEHLNHVAAGLAREAADGTAHVLGAIGPLGIRIEPLGPTSREEAEAYFGRQVDGLLEGGVDGFLLETFSDLEELGAAFRAVRARSDRPAFVQVTVTEEGATSYGTDVEIFARIATGWGADVIGLNCSVGPAGMLDAVERMAQVTETPISVLPNAGLPRTVGDRQIYLASPEYMARYARRLIDAGARFIGGCCGTTPEHIRLIRKEVVTVQPRHSRGTVMVVAKGDVQPPQGVEPVPLAERSPFGEKLASGLFVETVELTPPKGWQHDALTDRCRQLKAARIDAVAIGEPPQARARMGVLPAAIIVQRDVGLDTVVRYTCRDRNVLGMLSDLLGAAAAGIRNLFLTTGDPPSLAAYARAMGVFDIDSVGLTNVVYRLNHGLDQGGNPIGEPTRFVIGVAVNHAATDLDNELRRFYWKVDAGAEYAITHPVFDLAQLDAFLERAEQFHLPIVASVWTLMSARNAEYLANEVPGVTVPDTVVERMRRAQAGGDDAALAEGVRMAREIIAGARERVQGVQVAVPKGRVEVALEALARE